MTLLLVRLILLQKYILRFCGLVIGATKHFRPCLEIPQDFGVRILAPNVGRAGGFGCSFFFFFAIFNTRFKVSHWVLGIYKYNEEQILLKIEDRSVTC